MFGGNQQNIPDISTLEITEAPTRSKTSLLSSSIAAAAAAAASSESGNQNSASRPIEVPESAPATRIPEEPSLYATSEGDTISGRLVPSSSNISLFSLNNESSMNYDPSQQQLQQQLQQPSQPQNLNYSTFSPFERKNSLTSIASQRHHNNLHLQRHQHYMSLFTPLSGSASGAQTPNLRKMSTPGTPYSNSGGFGNGSMSTSPKLIPKPLVSSGGFSTFPPEPLLEPTSLGGSPSQFYLSSRTPPLSLGSTSYLLNFKGIQEQTQYKGGIKIHSQLIPINSDQSPDLMPIGTPNDMPPMTPLLLNGGTMEDFRIQTTEQGQQNCN